jgi:hypothetical protein
VATSHQILGRLRDSDGALSELVKRLLDDLLSRPVGEMVDPEWLARRFVDGLRASAADAHTEKWVRGLVQQGLERTGEERGSIGENLPKELVSPVKALLKRPYTPNKDIVHLLLDHPAMHELIRTVLVQVLTEFGKSLKPILPTSSIGGRKRGGALSQLVGAASEVASVVGAQVEERAEARVREFVDGAISISLDISVAHLCSEDFALPFGEWRSDSVDSLLGVPVETWVGELEALDPDALVTELVEIVRGLAAWDGLGELVEGLLSALMEEVGDSSLSQFLAGSGLEAEWRPQAEDLLLQRARDFVATDSFAEWLGDIVQDSG